MAAAGGEPTPYGVQDVLARADGEAAMGRDELRTSRIQQLGDPTGVLVLAATGLVNNGRPSAGGARQDTGTVGNVAHGHIGVFWGSARPLGHAWLDRARYLPHEWTDERERGQQAGIPGDRGVATKPQLARQLRARACAVGVPATGVTGDRV